MNVLKVEKFSEIVQILSFTREFIVKGSHTYVVNVDRPSTKVQILLYTTEFTMERNPKNEMTVEKHSVRGRILLPIQEFILERKCMNVCGKAFSDTLMFLLNTKDIKLGRNSNIRKPMFCFRT
jgi:hypothetical protein